MICYCRIAFPEQIHQNLVTASSDSLLAVMYDSAYVCSELLIKLRFTHLSKHQILSLFAKLQKEAFFQIRFQFNLIFTSIAYMFKYKSGNKVLRS